MSILTGAAPWRAAPHAGTWTLTMPPPAKWLNANDRYKRRPDKEIRAWRDAARLHAHAARLPKLQRAHLLVVLSFPDLRRRDVHNLYPTIKACVDGFVDYGLLPDDSHQYLVGPDLRLGEKSARRPGGIAGELRFAVTDLAHGSACPTCAGTGVAA
jgi:crossover junction endodeoxyribonuclease RusA